ncbi:MAG: response regulator transcription factor [Methylocystaceae bacterium]|nr:response regulator transcription factor [Methylocystaceae bacterium]
MPTSIKTILVDDDHDYLTSMTVLLENEGFKVFPFSSFKKMKQEIFAIKPHILILDVSLPGETAFEVLPELRNKTDFGLILVSGTRNLEYRVKGLEKGADIYLTKPVNIRELKAVIMSLYNRLSPQPKEVWCLDSQHRQIMTPDNRSLELTEKEFLFLELLISTNGEAVDKDKILQGLGTASHPIEEGSLHTLISRLRKKFANEGTELPIRAVRYIGYCFYEKATIK